MSIASTAQAVANKNSEDHLMRNAFSLFSLSLPTLATRHP